MFPVWAEVFGWMTSLVSVLCVPGFAIYQTLKHPKAKGSLSEVSLITPITVWQSNVFKTHVTIYITYV